MTAAEPSYVSDRGLRYMPDIAGTYTGSAVHIHDSSSADHPGAIWLSVADYRDAGITTVQLDREAAQLLAAQITALVDPKAERSHEDRCQDGDCVNSEAVVEALLEAGWDEVDGDEDNASILAHHVRMLARERDDLDKAVGELARGLSDACDAFVECTGPHAQQIAAPDLARWRALAGPLLTEDGPTGQLIDFTDGGG